MVETITPAGRGTRSWLIGLTLFTAGAVATAALLGLALGAALPPGGAAAAGAVAVFALLEAGAELGLVRLPLVHVRRQVPERWRERYPGPLVALLYGAGLGVGFATYLPVATLLVVAAGVAALAGPLGGAAVLAVFGAGRALALAVATVRLTSDEQAMGRLERMARLAGRRRLRRVNGAALALLGAVLALGAAAGTARAATQLNLGSNHVADPSAVTGVLAFDRISSGGSLTGVIRENGTFSNLPGWTPDLDGTRVVVDTGPDFQILDDSTLNPIETLTLQGRDPALSGHWLVYRRTVGGKRQIVLHNLTDDTSKVIVQTRLRTDLGPPDVDAPRVVYHRTSARSSRVVVYRIDTGATTTVRQTVIDSYFNPSISGRRVVYVRQTLAGMQVELLHLRSGRQVRVYALNKGSGRFLWTTGISSTHEYFTVYTDSDSHVYRAG
jgi:hypothetical protein